MSINPPVVLYKCILLYTFHLECSVQLTHAVHTSYLSDAHWKTDSSFEFSNLMPKFSFSNGTIAFYFAIYTIF